MKIAVIVNGISLNRDKFYSHHLPVLQQHFDTDVFETRSVNDAIQLTAKAVNKRYEVIISAGGDGTLNQVLNGILKTHEEPAPFPSLAILPIGSGNDFARVMNIPQDVHRLVNGIREMKYTEVDAGQVLFGKETGNSGELRYFLNVADVGMGPVVVRKVMKSTKIFGSAFAYYKSILSTFSEYKPPLLKASASGWEWKGKVRTFAIANGKYFGNGLCIAPMAKPDDGKLEVFACGNVSVFDFILQSLPLKRGKMIRHKEVTYHTVSEIELSSDEPMEIETDGEIVGMLPAKISVCSKKIKLITGY